MAGNRDLTLRVRCTPDELQEIDDIAQALGFDTRSDWVRAASLGSSVIVLAGGVDPSTPTATDDEK